MILSLHRSLTKSLTAVGNQVVQTIKDAKITDTIQSGVSKVTTTLQDPEFQENVKQKAQAGWSWLSSTASSLWSAARDTATSLVNEFNEQPAQPEVKSEAKPQTLLRVCCNHVLFFVTNRRRFVIVISTCYLLQTDDATRLRTNQCKCLFQHPSRPSC